MLGKKSRLAIGKLAGTWGSGYRTVVPDAATSPTSPLDLKIQSPRGLKKYDLLGGVGLGIVAALEKSGCEILANKPVFLQNLSSRSIPIPVKQPNSSSRGSMEEMEPEDNSEDYTFVTCHGTNKSYTIVYCDGVEYGSRCGHDRTGFGFGYGFERRSKNYGRSEHDRRIGFDISPARFAEDISPYPAPDFLSTCHLCHKKLHGKDIYMYRGEKAFCSTECRYRQIVMDERKEQCSSEASRSADVSNSPYTNGQIFSTGILAI